MTPKQKVFPFNPASYTASMADVDALQVWVSSVLACSSLKPPFKVIEFGCGSGKFSMAFSKMGCRVLCTDALPSMLLRAVANFPTLSVRQVVLPDLPDDLVGRFDLAFSEGLVEHFRGGRRVDLLRSMAMSLRWGGWLAVFVPMVHVDVDVNTLARATAPRRGREQEHAYTPDELAWEMREAGLDYVHVYWLNWTSRKLKRHTHLGCVAQKVPSPGSGGEVAKR